MIHKISLIAAIDTDNAIGKNGKIPWRGQLEADVKHFVNITKEKVVVMGRKTWDSLPEGFKPLPNRRNIVLTTDRKWIAKGCEVSNNMQDVLRVFRDHEIFVIGGGEIYKLFMPYATRLFITHIEHSFNGDVFFPSIGKEWKFDILSEHPVDKRNHFPCTIVEYTR
jgi:dihydrofolate reductase